MGIKEYKHQVVMENKEQGSSRCEWWKHGKQAHLLDQVAHSELMSPGEENTSMCVGVFGIDGSGILSCSVYMCVCVQHLTA